MPGQKPCQRPCQMPCQKPYQKACQMPCQMRCQKPCQMEADRTHLVNAHEEKAVMTPATDARRPRQLSTIEAGSETSSTQGQLNPQPLAVTSRSPSPEERTSEKRRQKKART